MPTAVIALTFVVQISQKLNKVGRSVTVDHYKIFVDDRVAKSRSRYDASNSEVDTGSAVPLVR